MKSHEERIEEINQLILEIAGGNFSRRLDLSSSFDELDAIASGINMLGEELQASMVDRNYFNSVLRSIADILILFDKDFRITQLNDQALKSLQQSQEELLGSSLRKLVHEDDQERLNNILLMLEEQGPLYNTELHFLNARQESLPLAVSVSKIMAQGQQPQGYVLIAKDLNEFYVFSDALKKKNEELKTFVYKVSHDLKGPVASLIGLLELMHREKKDPHALESYLQMMQTSLQRLDKSIVSLLNFTLSTRTDLLPQQIYIHATIKEIIQSLQAFPGIHEVMIQNSIPEDICLSSIPEILQSVLQNFIENAIKYRSRFRQARVHISARWLHNHLSIRIEDNGIGMSPYVKARAFDMYFRGHAEAAGSGLGLYITKHGLEEIGGDVSIDSEEGKGTSILLSLPNLSR